MQNFFSSYDFGEYTWIANVFLVVLATVVLNFILSRILERIHRTFLETDNLWDDAILLAARRPLLLFVWVMGLSIAAEIIDAITVNDIFQFTGLVRRIAIIFLLSMFLLKLVRNIEENVLKKTEKEEKGTDPITVSVIGRLLRLSVLITAGLVILQTLGISVTGVVAFGGIGGIAIGFAAQDLLANFFGGLMIYLDKPFMVGDWIRSPDRDIEGTVENIGCRLTRIRTFDKRPLYVPNSVFATIAVENPSRMTNRRIKETIGIRYDDVGKMEAIIDDVKKMLQEHEDIDANQTLIVNFNEFASSSLDFFIYTFTKTTNWIRFHEVKQDVLLKVIGIVESHGAECAFPTSTVHIPDGISMDQS